MGMGISPKLGNGHEKEWEFQKAISDMYVCVL